MEDKPNDQEEIQSVSSGSLIESEDDGSLSSEKNEEIDEELHPQASPILLLFCFGWHVVWV